MLRNNMKKRFFEIKRITTDILRLFKNAIKMKQR